ncbi:HAD hydrolase-like protein [Candidatus Uhrbacteria bacterium]|nr:HAD hydrolase-like protein [Candidatus Uhrbacteria bacterium]
MKTLYAWDFHGTLERGTEFVLAAICNILCAEYGVDVKVDGKFIVDHPSFHWRALFDELADGALSEDQLQEMSTRAYSDEFFHLNSVHSEPQPGAIDVLQGVVDNGDSNIVVSNSRPELIARYVSVVGLSDYFDAILGIESLDPGIAQKYDVTERKAAEIKEHLASHPGEFDRVVMIGDSHRDIEAGQQVGAITFMFGPLDTDRAGCEPDFWIDDLTKIEPLLNENA